MKEHFAVPWNFSFGGQSFVASFFKGVLLFVTKCDEGEGVQNRPKLRDVIYGRPLMPLFRMGTWTRKPPLKYAHACIVSVSKSSTKKVSNISAFQHDAVKTFFLEFFILPYSLTVNFWEGTLPLIKALMVHSPSRGSSDSCISRLPRPGNSTNNDKKNQTCSSTDWDRMNPLLR